MSTTLIALAAQAPAAAQGVGMTAATLLVLVVGILYCVWHKGTDWPTAVIFTVFGLFLAATSFGMAAKAGVADGADNAVGFLMGLFA